MYFFPFRTVGLVLALFLVPITAPVPAQAKSCQTARTKIVGGDKARLKDWPGQAAIRLYSNAGRVAFYFCGGTVISERWVLTAAHCVHDFTRGLTEPIRNSKREVHQGRLEVVLGSGDLTAVPQTRVFAAERIIIAGNYLAAVNDALKIADGAERNAALGQIALRVGDDIALIKLARPWTGAVATLSLALASDPVTPPESQVRVAGFGRTEFNKDQSRLDRFIRKDGAGELYAGSSRLLETAVETVATSKCAARYSGFAVGKGQVCAGLDEGGQDSCQGDSGGPLVAYYEAGCPRQIGIVSWGDGCAKKDASSVYTRVSHYADWIQRHTGPLKGASAVAATVSGNRLSVAQLREAVAQLKDLLGSAGGKIGIGVRGGNRVRLGQDVNFEASSSIKGRLAIIDINADREVTLIYPNKYTAPDDPGLIKAGALVSVPGPDYPGFSSFRAVEPTGKGWLIALVVPEDFDIEPNIWPRAERNKGFAPRNDPPSFLMRLIRQIEVALGLRARAGGGSRADELKRWGYAIAEYEITR